MEKNVVCPRCQEFIGEIGNLDVCPICGYNLIGEDNETE